jgi:hypothetical protein
MLSRSLQKKYMYLIIIFFWSALANADLNARVPFYPKFERLKVYD